MRKADTRIIQEIAVLPKRIYVVGIVHRCFLITRKQNQAFSDGLHQVLPTVFKHGIGYQHILGLIAFSFIQFIPDGSGFLVVFQVYGVLQQLFQFFLTVPTQS